MYVCTYVCVHVYMYMYVYMYNNIIQLLCKIHSTRNTTSRWPHLQHQLQVIKRF
jgi:hypothetical protein